MRSRRPYGRIHVLSVPAVLGAVLALAAAACGSTEHGATTEPLPHATTPGSAAPPASPRSPPPPMAGTWRLLPRAPVADYPVAPVSVWTGREMLIHGVVSEGSAYHRGVTLSYNPATGRWRTLAPGPAVMLSQNNDAAVWTGTEMLVLGLTSAAYNPVTNTWRHLPPAPVVAAGAVHVWTGHQAILWGGGCCGGATATGAAYTPATNSWRVLPAGPLSNRTSAGGAWTGTELIIAGGSRQGSGTIRAAVFADAAAYNPVTRTWRKLPPLPHPASGPAAIWDGKDVLYIGGADAKGRPSADVFAFSPSAGRWRQLSGMELGRSQFAAVWTGRQVLVWGGRTGSAMAPVTPPHGVAYDPAANRWSALPMAPLRGRDDPMAVWTGSQMIVWGGWPDGTPGYFNFADGAAYTPAAR